MTAARLPLPAAAAMIPGPGPEGAGRPSWADLGFFRDADQEGLTAWERLHARLGAATAPWQPEPGHIFRALTLTPRHQVRVVVLGQDPYHTPGRAQGLAFSFPKGEAPRDSLKNILTELGSNLGALKMDGDLSAWAKQGVLLLNTALTVPLGEAFGHKTWGWAGLVSQILAATATDGPRAFLLWGAPAQKLCAKLPREGHLFHASAHPSPLSAYRGFFGSRPFSAVNDWLTAQGQSAIDWAA